MSSHLQWPDLLEEEAYLVQLVSENPYDFGALEQTSSTLDILRTDLQSCVTKVADLERDIRNNDSKGSPPSSSTARFFHRITASISSEHSHEEYWREQDVQNERLLDATTKSRTLRMEIKNLEIKAQVLRRRTRHYEELKHRLKTLYERVFSGSNPSSPEEDEADKEVRKAVQALHQAQKTMECHRTLTALLGHGDFALSNAAPHLSAALSSEKKDSKMFQSEIIAAKGCALQAYIVVDQAKRLDPRFFEQQKGDDLFKPNWLSNVFRNQVSDNNERSTLPLSQQALQMHHKALLSLLSLARQRWQEHETNLRRATRWHAEACGRKHAIRRRILLKYAGIEGKQDERSLREADGSRSGLARARDVTAGLDQYVAIPTVSGLAVPQGDTGAGSRRSSAEEARRSPNPDPAMGRSLDVATSRLQPRPLTPNSMQRSASPNATLYPRFQGSPGLPAVATPQRPPPPEGPSRLHQEDTTAGPSQSRAPEQHNLRPSLERPSEELRITSGRGSPRLPLLPINHLPSTSTRGEHESRSRAARPDTQAPTNTQSRAPGQVPSVDRSRAPLMQPPSGSVRADDASLHAGHSRSLPESTESKSLRPAIPPKRTVGILKAPGVPQPPPPTDLTDPWGVKVASAGPSRPRPKLKNIIGNALRGVEAFKANDNQDARSDSSHGSTFSSRPHESPLRAHAQVGPEAQTQNWTTMQKLRFSEAVALIPRPALDSDPYSDEEDDYMPAYYGEEDEDDDDSSPVAFSQRGPIQVDPAPKGRDFANVSSPASSSYSQESPAHYIHAPAPYTPVPDLSSALTNPSPSQSPRLAPIDTLGQQRLRQGPLEHLTSGTGAGVNQGDRQRRDVGAPRAYPEQSGAPRTLPEMGRLSSDDLRLDGRRALTTPEKVSGRFVPPSDPNSAASSGLAQRNPLAHAAMTRGGPEVRSDHDLVQAIFPSPSSTISERDLLFTN